jgi:hypothetical protein
MMPTLKLDQMVCRRPRALGGQNRFATGTGVGWLAIEAAHVWPALRVVGIDQWEPALALARENLGKSGVAERVEIRLQCVEDLEETARFSLAWLPGPFIVWRACGSHATAAIIGLKARSRSGFRALDFEMIDSFSGAPAETNATRPRPGPGGAEIRKDR